MILKRKKIISIISFLLIALMFFTFLSACNSSAAADKNLKKITVILDWVPNTNHTGIYIARENGYYFDEGLEVEIIQPSEGGSADLIAANKGEFGVSYQEQVTYARTADDPLPVVAVAAIIQHNTSGFASPINKNIQSPADFENKKYGGWGSPMEEAMLEGLMEKYNADYSKLEIVNIGASDFFTSVERDVDFAWIFYGWTGINAEIIGFPIDFMLLQDVDPILDFYTPIIITSEDMIKNDPDLVRSFLAATEKGYSFAIDNPQEAADIFLSDNSDLDREIVAASQQYLSKNYVNYGENWGVMRKDIWESFSSWMYDNSLLNRTLDIENAYTNEFLPE